ncbi:MAG: hypothetical protein CVU06_02155 [Bacteroidetes bacterium HGW-Bacteroidetes-22]|nr:MAG: hypothetical protein CVU06_02155 [Bacteroidetes bacterium HGW-Bacteroidetes-22]
MNTSKLLHLKATCLGSDIATPEQLPYRTLLVPTHLSIYQMTLAILNSFDFDNENSFSFYNEKDDQAKPKFEKSATKLAIPKLKDVKRNLIDRLFRSTGDTWFMLYDYEDRWWFEIKLIEISDEMPVGKYPRILTSQYDNPIQYPDFEEEIPRVSKAEKADLSDASAEVDKWFTDVHHDEISKLFTSILIEAIDQQNRFLDEENSLVERLGKDFALTNLVDLYFSLRDRLLENINNAKHNERAQLIINNWTNGPIDIKSASFSKLTTNDKADLLLGKAYLSHYLSMKELADQISRISPDNIANILLMSLFAESAEKVRMLRRVEKLICQKISLDPDGTVDNSIYDEPLIYDLLDVWRDLSVILYELGLYNKAIICTEYLLKWTDEKSEPDHQLLLPLLYLHTHDFKRFQPEFDKLKQLNRDAASYHWIIYEKLTGADEKSIEASIEKAIKTNPKIALYLTTDTEEEYDTPDKQEAIDYFNNCMQVWNHYPDLIEMLESSLADAIF